MSNSSNPIINRKKILIAEDESEVRELLGEVLSAEYQVLFASDGKKAIEQVERFSPDAIILDFKMPLMNGLEVCRFLKRSSETANIPIIMLTACNDPQTRIKLFQEGVVDFISKPFNLDELLVRVQTRLALFDRAILNFDAQAELTSEKVSLSWNGLNLDISQRRIDYRGVFESLKETECKILRYLIEAKGDVCNRKDLFSSVWSSENENDRTLDVHISSLRKVLKRLSFDIKTAYGMGYSIIQVADKGSAVGL